MSIQKTKIFSNSGSTILEAEVNQWLEANPNINIIDKLFSSHSMKPYSHYALIIFYYET